jgi:glycerol-3-phosphate dehydrogenase
MIDGMRIDPDHRARTWEAMREAPVDVLVIGGGVTGAGAALDAVTRGLSVALVEARDWASGTSSRSSKLFHGGLRYLEQLNFSLVREALRERDLMLSRIAPHLVKPVPFLYPLQHRAWERPYVGAGLTLYDQMAGMSRPLPRHRHHTRTGALKLCPALRREALVGAVRYYDALTDDARHTLTLVRTAARFGAQVRSSTEVVDLLREGDRVVGAVLSDVESGEQIQLRARVVVNATGVWTDDIQRLAGGRGRFRVRASKGVHIVVPRDRIASETGLVLRTASSVLFVIPWGNRWVIGTTDTDWNLDRAHPAATRTDIDYLLEHVNSVLAVRLTRDDVQGVYAGLRPLLSGESESTSQLSREHAVARPMAGLVSLAGGKYTTYRLMAAEAIDAAAADLGERLNPSVTEHVPLVGADGYHALVNQVSELGERYRIPPWRMRHLLDRYGSLATEVLATAEDDPLLLEPLPGAEDYLRAEIRYGVTHEGALHLDDLLARRTRLSIEYGHRGTASARAAADLVADVMDWDLAQVEQEVETYVLRVKAEMASQELPTDEAADEARRAAPDSRARLVAPR